MGFLFDIQNVLKEAAFQAQVQSLPLVDLFFKRRRFFLFKIDFSSAKSFFQKGKDKLKS